MSHGVQGTATDKWRLVRHVYSAHPPRNPAHRLNEGEQDLKKVLLQAVAHYHPDKQAGSVGADAFY